MGTLHLCPSSHLPVALTERCSFMNQVRLKVSEMYFIFLNHISSSKDLNIYGTAFSSLLLVPTEKKNNCSDYLKNILILSGYWFFLYKLSIVEKQFIFICFSQLRMHAVVFFFYLGCIQFKCSICEFFF